MKAFVSGERNELEKHLFWFSNFKGAPILKNNCDESWLPYCFKTKAVCMKTITAGGQGVADEEAEMLVRNFELNP